MAHRVGDDALSAPRRSWITDDVVRRWLFAEAQGVDAHALTALLVRIGGLTVALVAALYVNHQLQHRLPTTWMLAVIALALGMARLRFEAAAGLAARLLQLLGAVTAFFALIHYPLMPSLGTSHANGIYALVLIIWLASLASGVACFRFPSLALIPPAFVVWSSVVAIQVTGLKQPQKLDVEPLPEVALCLGLGLGLLSLYRWQANRRGWQRSFAGVDPAVQFARIVLMLAISIHLANYFWSALAKLAVHGPFLSWVTLNNPIYIYLTAYDDDYITFSEYAVAALGLARAIDSTHIISNIAVLVGQGLALVGFLLPRRALMVLLVVFDLMHLSIAVAAGANFWPWILLNVVIAAVVTTRGYVPPRPLIGLAAAGFICVSPVVANIALLGWYDSGANNKVFFQAEDVQGRRYYVSPNFFTFYSYPIGHMNYGMPAPETAFAVGDPQGGTRDYAIAKAGIACDVASLIRPGAKRPVDHNLARFVINYTRMARAIEDRVGTFPYNLYPHHFYVRPALNAPFDALDKSRITAYIYRRESVCMSLVDGKPHRRLVNTGEYRIEMPRD